MTSQRFSYTFILILIMALTPVMSVFGYYSGMASLLYAEPSLEPGITLAEMTNDTKDAASRNSDQCPQHNKVKTACQANSSCSFHLCGYGGITALFVFPEAFSPNRYGHLEKSIFNSLPFSPDLRPPIRSL